MNTRCTLLLTVISLFSATASHAQELWNRTTADASASGDRQVSVEINSEFLLSVDRSPRLQESDVVATWERAGGIEPTPFRILIPAGCFVSKREGLVVRGTHCGVQVFFDGEMIEAQDFAAEVPADSMSDGITPVSLRMSIEADATRAGNLLGTLGGAEVSLTIGRESGVAIPKSIDAVAGIEPTPF